MNKIDATSLALDWSAQVDEIVLVYEKNCDDCEVMEESEYVGERVVVSNNPQIYLHGEQVC